MPSGCQTIGRWHGRCSRGSSRAMVKKPHDTPPNTSRPSRVSTPWRLLMDADGNVICDEQGMPVVTQVPLNVVGIEGRKVYLRVHRADGIAETVASIADVHVATVNRAVRSGELPRPMQISSRRVADHLADVRHWMARKTTPAK